MREDNSLKLAEKLLDPLFEVRTLPPTAKGRQTRDLLLSAARKVFESTSFMDSTVSDIVREAGFAHGSFYTYFDSKDHIFWEVIEDVTKDMYFRDTVASDSDTPHERGNYEYYVARIDRANRRLIDSYRKNAQIIRALEEVATYNDYFRELRSRTRNLFVERAETGVREVQQSGFADPGIDAHYAAHALGSMVDRFAYVWFVLKEPFDYEMAVSTLTDLWVNALKMSRDRWRTCPDR